MFLKTLDEKQKNNLKNLNGILKKILALRFTWQKKTLIHPLTKELFLQL